MACLPRSTIPRTRSKRTCDCVSADVRAFVVRQPVRHSSWQHRRQTVRPRCLRAARQQQDAAEQREARALPRVHHLKGQLNNALPKAKRRPPANIEEKIGAAVEAAVERPASREADGQYAADAAAATSDPDQLLDVATAASTSFASAVEPDQSAAAPPEQRAAFGTVLGAIALITGKDLVSHITTVQQCRATTCQEI